MSSELKMMCVKCGEEIPVEQLKTSMKSPKCDRCILESLHLC